MWVKIILKIEFEVPQMFSKTTLWLKYPYLSRISALNVQVVKNTFYN